MLLSRLEKDPRAFYGDHHDSVVGLLDQKRTEAQHRVAAKLARAKREPGDLGKRLGTELFAETTGRMEQLAERMIHPELVVAWDVEATCPACASRGGRLFGIPDAAPEIDFDHERIAPGEYESFPYVARYEMTLAPEAFMCNVCQLSLFGSEELAATGLPSLRHAIEMEDLGEDFDVE